MTSLSATALGGLPEIGASDDLAALIAAAAPADLADGDILSIAHKAVSKAQGRVRAIASIAPTDRARAIAERQNKDPRVVQAVLDESAAIIREGPGVLVCETRHGFICANAGVDHSNTAGDGELILLPEDPDGTARVLRTGIAALRGVRPAVLISDSFGRAWRVGQTDTAIGAAGLQVLDDWAGRADATGRPLSATAIAIGDAVAAAADLARAKDSAEPVVLIRGLERFVTQEDGPGAAALRRNPDEDLFR